MTEIWKKIEGTLTSWTGGGDLMVLTIGTPSPKQVQFLTADTKFVGFGGA